MRVFEKEEEKKDSWLADFVQQVKAGHGPEEPGGEMADRIRSDVQGIVREKLQERQVTQDASQVSGAFTTPSAAGDAAGAPEESDGDLSGGLTLASVTSADTFVHVGTIDTGSYGNKFNGTSDADGRVDATFNGTGENLLLTFDGYDIDFNDEVEVLLNGVSLGYLSSGVNNGLSSYQFQITAAQQQAGDNVISFVQRGDVNWAWGVTNILLEPSLPVTTLEIGNAETGSYGNKFNGTSDDDGHVYMSFTGTGEDLVLTFDGYDIDFNDEVEVLLNGVSLGYLSSGVNNGLSSYQFQITAAQQQAGDNVISFVQRGDVNWAWGVTNVLLSEGQPETDSSLSLGITDTGSYGNKFNGTSDADGRVDMSFTSTGEDLILTFDGYDIDFNDEVEVLLNGVSLGYLDAGTNNGLSSYQLQITAAQQQAGDNVISFVQRGDVNWAWGVTNVLLSEDQPDTANSLTLGITDTGSYGNKFNGTSDIDGRVDMSFASTGEDLMLTFDGYDIDFNDEVEVLLNGVSLGYLDAGTNNGLSSYQFQIAAAQQQAGDNVISFVQRGDVNWAWGVTNVLLAEGQPDTVSSLSLGITDTGSYGNNFNGTSDADGRVDMSFTGTGEDLELTFDGYDIDFNDEVEVLLNGVSLGYLNAGTDGGLTSYQFQIAAAQQQAGDNVISFVQRGDVNWAWGVTNILLAEDQPDATLEIGVTETGSFGNNFNGTSDIDGRVDMSFTGTGEDIVLTVDGYDMDYQDEVEVLLNGVSLGFLDSGANDGLTSYQFRITAAQQQAGDNVISFVQRGDVNWTWGVTNVLIDIAPVAFVPDDPFYADQYHLHEIGYLERAWADYTGDGVSVGIYDNGIQYSHYDLNDNYDASKHVIVNGQVLDPSTGTAEHGTAVAGVIAAEADGVGTVGVAFDAGITGVDVFSGAASSNNSDISGFVDAMMQMTNFDVINHSWAWLPLFTTDDQYDNPEVQFYTNTLPTLENAAVNGRGGLGTVMVKAAGNEGASAQGDLLNSSRFTINVGATDSDGDISWYSNHGANILVTAPSSGDFLFNLGVKTTDLLGSDGYTLGDYTGTDGITGFGGTSSATPVVTGVIALMLEANPNLGWRDVHDILAYSATHAGSAINLGPISSLVEGYTWRFNGAENWNGGGLHISEDYGYGDVDAYNAVRMAEVWHLFGTAQTSANEGHISESGSPGLSIGSGTTIEIDLTGATLGVDYVELAVSLSDSTVDIFLSSPDGTLVEVYRSGDAPAGALNWTFGSQLFRGEEASGVWTLQIVNADGGSAILNDYSIDWTGSADGVGGYYASDDVYHYTDEVFAENIFTSSTSSLTSIADDATRTTLTDDDGGTDWLNMAAMTGDLDVSLADGGVGTSAGLQFLTIAAGADIENAIAGDGDDRLSGNDLDNTLMGMRGDDELHGLDGADCLIGGAGDDALWGGLGADCFVFADDFGIDTIFDFQADSSGGIVDTIDFQNLTEATDFNTVMFAMFDSAEGAVYDLGGDGQNVILFQGLNTEDFSQDYFLFA